jgi:hypothetical protein
MNAIQLDPVEVSLSEEEMARRRRIKEHEDTLRQLEAAASGATEDRERFERLESTLQTAIEAPELAAEARSIAEGARAAVEPRRPPLSDADLPIAAGIEDQGGRPLDLAPTPPGRDPLEMEMDEVRKRDRRRRPLRKLSAAFHQLARDPQSARAALDNTEMQRWIEEKRAAQGLKAGERTGKLQEMQMAGMTEDREHLRGERGLASQTRDPQSPGNLAARQAFESLYPQIVERMGEQWESTAPLSSPMVMGLLEKAGVTQDKLMEATMKRLHDMEDFEAKEGFKLGQSKELFDYKAEHELQKAALMGGQSLAAAGGGGLSEGVRGGGSGVSTPEDVLFRSFLEPYGGPEEAPEWAREAAAVIAQERSPKRRSELASQFVKQRDEELKHRRETRGEEHKYTRDQAERYGNALRGSNLTRALENYNNVYNQLRDVLKLPKDASLEDVEAAVMKGGADIPGTGLTSALPTWAVSKGGKNLRHAMKRLLDTELRLATGANAPESEHKTFGEILGMGEGMTDKDFITALSQGRIMLQRMKANIAASYDQSAVSFFEQNLARQEDRMGLAGGRVRSRTEAQGRPGATVRVRHQGRVLEIPRDDLDEALKDGAELVN